MYLHCTHHTFLYVLIAYIPNILYTTGGALPAVVVSSVVAFLLLTLLIAGIIVGAVLLGRKEHKKRILSQNVDKSKNHKGEKTQGAASAITTQGTDTEEQHYECSSGFGQDWFGTAVEVNPEATLCNAAKGCSSTDTDTNGEQLEPYNTNAVYGMVDMSKKKIQSRKSGDIIPFTYGMDGM